MSVLWTVVLFSVPTISFFPRGNQLEGWLFQDRYIGFCLLFEIAFSARLRCHLKRRFFLLSRRQLGIVIESNFVVKKTFCGR